MENQSGKDSQVFWTNLFVYHVGLRQRSSSRKKKKKEKKDAFLKIYFNLSATFLE